MRSCFMVAVKKLESRDLACYENWMFAVRGCVAGSELFLDGLGEECERLGTQTERSFYLPRLAREFYQAGAVVLWTLSVEHRATGWLTAEFHHSFRELMLHAAVREQVLCPIYCLMPDHIHLVWMGLSLDSDQRNGMAFLRRYLEPSLSPAKFQMQAHDHVLSAEERKRRAFAATCDYICDNPVRAGLVEKAETWLYTGAVVPGMPMLEVFAVNYWEKFWKFYEARRDPKCAERILPRRQTRGIL